MAVAAQPTGHAPMSPHPPEGGAHGGATPDRPAAVETHVTTAAHAAMAVPETALVDLVDVAALTDDFERAQLDAGLGIGIGLGGCCEQ